MVASVRLAKRKQTKHQMNPDIVRKIKQAHLKATFDTLARHHRLFLIIFLISLFTTVLPHITYANAIEQDENNGPALVFDGGNSDYQDYIDQLNLDLTDKYYREQMLEHALRQQRLSDALRTYLQEHRSPLAQYAPVLVTLRNWKKIVALSNAESTMCQRYPQATSNCWGVGGSNLWEMGDNLGQGVIAMNRFLNLYPRHSALKYHEMTFEQMNGLYKQPPAQHWVDNNQIVYDDLVAMEKSIE